MRLPNISLLLLIPAALLAGQARYARLGDFQGQVDVQLSAADPWMPAERNLPLTEAAWVRTGAGAHLEIEFDDGGVWRLGPDSQGEISDYSRLSTGQRITLLSLDHGIAYFTGQPAGKDVIMLVVPGAQLTVSQGSRIRTIAEATASQIAVLEGQIRFSAPAAEMDIRERTTAKVEPAYPSRFSLFPEVTANPLDRWSEDRDKLQAAPASAVHVSARFGAADLDAAGKWVVSPDLGLVWKPDVDAAWTPYRNGKWQYFETLGYTWVSDDSWGWLPYHNGRWSHQQRLGWIWQPSADATFHPAQVYWVRVANLVGWGPLAPDESQATGAQPSYAAANTTYATFLPDWRVIDPGGFPAPTAEQLQTLAFILAPPSPVFLVSRLDATRPVLKVGATRILPSVPGITLGDPLPSRPAPDTVTNPVSDAPPPPPTVASDSAAGPPPPPDGVYPVPVAAIPVVEIPVVINPPDHPTYARPLNRTNTAATTGASTATAPVKPARPPVAGTTAPPAAEPIQRPPRQPAPTRPVIPVPAKQTTPATPKAVLSPGELEIYRKLQSDTTGPVPNYQNALVDLKQWSARFPASQFETERAYQYVRVYLALGRNDLALNTAAPLVAAGVARTIDDPEHALQILVAASVGVRGIPNATAQQWNTADHAARDLLEFLPGYFTDHRPAGATDAQLAIMRGQLETAAKQVIEARRSTYAVVR